MKIGLVPMSAKPFHRGHAGLIEIASNENDKVIVFVGFGSRGIKKRTKKKRKFEQPLSDEFPIYGDTMKKVWQGSGEDQGLSALMSMKDRFNNVKFVFPGDELEGGVAAPGPLQSVLTIFLSLVIEKNNKGDLQNVNIPFLGTINNPAVSVYSDPEDTMLRYSVDSLTNAVRSAILKVSARDIKSMQEFEVNAAKTQAMKLVNTVLNKNPGFTPRAIKRGEGTVDISGTRVRQLLQNLRMNLDMPESEYNEVIEELVNSLPELPDGEAKKIVEFLVSVAKERDRLGGVFPDELSELNRSGVRSFLCELKNEGSSSDNLIVGTEEYNLFIEKIMLDIRKVKESLRSRKKSGNYYRKEASKLQGALEALKYLGRKSSRLLQNNNLKENLTRSDIRDFLHNYKK